MWQIKAVRSGEETEYLALGWEPFAVVSRIISHYFYDNTLGRQCQNIESHDYVYLRKEASCGD